MKLLQHKSFIKSYRNLDIKIQFKVDDTIMSFISDPFHQLLNNHALSGRLQWLRSINVTGDYRIHFRDINGDYELVELVRVWTHSQLYG